MSMDIDDELDEARSDYYSGRQSKMTDAEFNVLEKYGSSSKVGYTDRRNVPLPKELSTLKKLNQENLVLRWEKRWLERLTFAEKDTNFIYMDKIDGIHCLLHYSATSTTPNAFTRGDGKCGMNITHFNINAPKLKVESDVFVEGELVLNEDDYMNHCSEKANARTAVAGMFNSNQPSPGIAFVRFIAFSIDSGKDSHVPIVEQLNILKRLNFDTCHFKPVVNISWCDILEFFENESLFKKDGVVISVNHINCDEDFKIAVKPMSNEDVADTIVTKIEWNSSKDQKQIPTIHFNEIVFDKVVVRKCTGHNQDFIASNKIGIGATILISYEKRIPVLKKVIVPCEDETEFQPPPVDKMVVAQKRLEAFFKRMGTSGIGLKMCMLLAEKCIDKIKNFTFSNGTVMKKKQIVDVLSKNLVDVDTFVKCNVFVKTVLKNECDTHEEAGRLLEFIDEKPLMFNVADLTLFRALFSLSEDELFQINRKKDFLFNAIHVDLGMKFRGQDLLARIMSAMFIYGSNLPFKSVEKRLKEEDPFKLQSLLTEIGFGSNVIAKIYQ